MTHTLGLWLVAIPCSFLIYSYVAYPALVWLLSRLAPDPTKWGNPPEWPEITIILPCYNEERSVAATIESLLALDYPAEKRQILVISDASSDRTDDIVHSYGGEGSNYSESQREAARQRRKMRLDRICVVRSS